MDPLVSKTHMMSIGGFIDASSALTSISVFTEEEEELTDTTA
jgi:hypothetical protein